MPNKIEYAKKIAIPKMQGQAKLYCFTQTQLENILAEPKLSQSDEEVIEEFENRSNDSKFLEDEIENSFWFEEGDEIRYDQEDAGKWLRAIIAQKNTEIEEAGKKERERILSNILKWSTTATVTETTGKEGAKRATTKLRASLAGCYHFLYQAIRIDHLTDSK